MNGAERKGLGFGERGPTGGIRLLPARANQRLLGMGWLGMGRVKGVCWPGGQGRSYCYVCEYGLVEGEKCWRGWERGWDGER